MADIVSERYAQSLYEVAKDEKQEKEYLILFVHYYFLLSQRFSV